MMASVEYALRKLAEFGTRRQNARDQLSATNKPTIQAFMLNQATQTSGATRRHIPSLDGLRGLAALVVVLFHAELLLRTEGESWDWLRRVVSPGWLGVDLFFVLSGFLITGILLEARKAGGYFRNFYGRRLLRIFPLCYAVVFGLLILLGPGSKFWADQWWYWAYLENWLFAIEANWDTPLPHFWSLAIEEQFYIVWPVVVLCLTRRQLKCLCLGLAGVALAARIAAWLAGLSPISIFVATPCRWDGLALGGLAAVFAAEEVSLVRAARWAMIAGLLGFIGVGLAESGFSEYAPLMQTIGFSSLAVLFAGLIASLADETPWRGRWLFEFRWLRWFGGISYALYVFHNLIAIGWVTYGPAGISPWIVLPGYLAASVLAAWLSWHLLEMHFLRLKPYFSTMQLAALPELPRLVADLTATVEDDAPAAEGS